MRNVGTQKIESDKLILRKFELEDNIAIYNNWASDEEVTKYLTWQPHASIEATNEILQEWVNGYDDPGFYQWAIIAKEFGNEPIGSIGVVSKNEAIGMVHIGYCIGKKYWHKGITSKALEMVIQFLFEEALVNRIESRHDTRNTNSGGVMKKCGMKYEGTLRQSDQSNQGICDASYYGILSSEWK